jgi:hypothetical protein
MFARLIVPAVAAALVLSTSAFAAATSTNSGPGKVENKVQTAAVNAAARCTGLENQFDLSIKTHGSAAKADSARMLRTEGGALCSKGEHEAGIVKIEQALKELGVTPDM